MPARPPILTASFFILNQIQPCHQQITFMISRNNPKFITKKCDLIRSRQSGDSSPSARLIKSFTISSARPSLTASAINNTDAASSDLDDVKYWRVPSPLTGFVHHHQQAAHAGQHPPQLESVAKLTGRKNAQSRHAAHHHYPKFRQIGFVPDGAYPDLA